MKKIKLAQLTIFLFVLIVFGISAFTLADTTTEINKEAEQHFENANELLKLMDYEAAISEYKKVVNMSPNSKIAQDAQYWIGQSHFKAGQFDDAQATFAKLIETYPTSAIVPVTKLMVERVEKAREDEEIRKTISDAIDKGIIIDPNTGVQYTRTKTFAGKNDVIEDTTYPNVVRENCLQLSPNGKFLLYDNLVVPLDGSDPFDLVDISATRTKWSPDGTKVAFYSGDAICVVPVSPETGQPTGPVIKLLDGNYKFQMKVSWSPDGEKLVFRGTRNIKEGIIGGTIWTLSVKDGSLRQISGPGRQGAPAWSPDGKNIVYGMIEGNRNSFCLVSAEGGEPTKTIEPGGIEPGGTYLPIWSPDGKWILYETERKIHFFGLSDEQEFEIIPPAEVVGDFFSWSPDGKKMLFYRPSFGYKYDIKVVSVSGGPPVDLGRQITLYPEHLWSPDSKVIVAEGGSEDGRYGIWITPLSGGKPVFLEMDVSVDGGPLQIIGVSPNVENLAFSVNREDGNEDLFVVPISSQEARTTGPAVKVFDGLYRAISGTNLTTSWSPDSDKIAVIHRGDVWIAFCNGDEPAQITKTRGLRRPGWSPDGSMINYIMAFSEAGTRTYYIRAVSGGEAMEIPGADRTSAWSPDSKQLVIQSEGVISIVSVADGETRQIANLNDLGLEEVFYFSWSPDGKYIACVGEHIEKGDAGPIFVIPVEGGKATTLVTNDNSYKYLLHWSPDGKWISYNSEGPVKVRPEGTMWEADFDEIVSKLSD